MCEIRNGTIVGLLGSVRTAAARASAEEKERRSVTDEKRGTAMVPVGQHKFANDGDGDDGDGDDDHHHELAKTDSQEEEDLPERDLATKEDLPEDLPEDVTVLQAAVCLGIVLFA